MSEYHFEPQLSRASTIPADWYFDPSMLEREYRAIFRRTWQLAGRLEQVPDPGSYLTGRYSVKRENGVHHFHGLLAEYLESSKQ